MVEKIIKCPHCQSELSVDEQYFGMQLQCPVCRKEFTAEKQDQEPDKNNGVPKLKLPASDRSKIGNVLDRDKINAANYGVDKAAAPLSNAEYSHLILCRKVIRKYFNSLRSTKSLADVLTVLTSFTIIVPVILLIRRLTLPRPSFIVNCFRQLKRGDTAVINGIDVLARFGKSAGRLVSAPVTLFSPAIDDDGDDFSYKYGWVDHGGDALEYVYSSESVTKVYTFPDQLFVYRGIWDYMTGKFIHEETETFFFKDITNISSENEYEEIENERIPFGEIIKQYKNAFKKLIIGIIIALPLIWGAAYLWHIIDRPSMEVNKKEIVKKVDFIINDKRNNWRWYGEDGEFKKNYSQASDKKKSEVRQNYIDKLVAEADQKIAENRELQYARHWEDFKIWAWVGTFIAAGSPLLFIVILLLIWLCSDPGSSYYRISDTLTITAGSGDDISITILCDEWLDANHGVLTGKVRSSGEQSFQAIRKMVEEKKVELNE
ncbi:MAG: hypothetical protein E7043_06610 [Lentisphaerae bacterium]|nr:hypothetical protein [Lentisphaerota bacterium]